jgi:hypothetical protein
VRQRTHGRSLVPLLQGEATSVRDWLVTGIWGREVHLVDLERRYCRAPVGDNAPISMWSNRWSTMPVHVLDPEVALPLPDHRAVLDHMPGTTVPVIRQPWGAGDGLPFWAWAHFDGSHLWDRVEDPAESRDLVGAPAEADAAERLRVALVELDAPDDQFVRLGLA